MSRTYLVSLRRPVYEYAEVEIDADSAEEASTLALDAPWHQTNWESACNNIGDAIVTEIDGQPVSEDRWASASDAFRAEHPWCGWLIAFGADSDGDTTCFGLERLVGINLLLTTADGRSRPATITAWRRRAGCIAVRELDTTTWEPLADGVEELIAYEDIREVVVF